MLYVGIFIMKKKYIAVFILAILNIAAFSYLMITEGKTKEASAAKVYYYENMVALTFDDGPSPKYTEELLDGLKERGVVATFFLLGESIPGNEQLVKRMQEEGHLVGNHTYSHVDLSKLNHDDAVLEIKKTNDLIYAITGEEVKYIRPPFGAWTDKLEEEIDMTPVLWSVDPRDWNCSSAATVVGRVIKNTGDGDIILFHDIFRSSVAAALEVVDQLKAKGYVFVTVDELLIE